MVFDVLKIEVNARSVANALLYSSECTTEVERILRMLEKNKVLIGRKGYYRLYARQDDFFETQKEGQPSSIQLWWIKLLVSFSVCKSVQFIELGKTQVFLASFPASLATQKVKARCKLMRYLLGQLVYCTSHVRSEHKHELSAVLFSLSKNVNTGLTQGLNFSWVQKFIPNIFMRKKRAFTRLTSLNISDSSEYELNFWLSEMELNYNFKEEYKHRLNHIRFWLLPQLGIKSQQNRMV